MSADAPTDPRRKGFRRYRKTWLVLAALVAFLVWKNWDTDEGTLGQRIGVVEVTGMILDSQEIVKDLHDFASDEGISAILLRVDSPGGGIGPSQEIYREVFKAREKKKVVVSMGSTAASGGYYVSAPADRIMANPGTVTGSIGVLMEFVDLQEVARWFKVKTKTLTSGPFKSMGSPFKPLRPEEEAVFQNMILELKEQFIADIAAGRKAKVEDIRRLSDGRIFTGAQAKKLGLVDDLGNFQDAVALAAELSGMTKEPHLVYPKRPQTFLDMMVGEKKAKGVLEGLSFFGQMWDIRLPYFFYF